MFVVGIPLRVASSGGTYGGRGSAKSGRDSAVETRRGRGGVGGLKITWMHEDLGRGGRAFENSAGVRDEESYRVKFRGRRLR